MSSFDINTTIQEISAAYPGSIEGCTFLVTGSTNGLGLAFANFVAQQGARTVVLTGRTEKKLSKALKDVKLTANPKTVVKTVILDLSSQESIHHVANEITSGALGIPKIDVLLNNAGIMMVPFKKINGCEEQFFCNHVGHFLLTNLILSHITSPGGRIVNTTSDVHGMSPVRFDDINFQDAKVYNKLQAYAQSKSANILFTKELNVLLSESKGIQSFAVHPGVIPSTGLFDHLDLASEGITDKNGNWLCATVSLDQGIATYLYAALSPEINGKGGTYLTQSQIQETAYPITDTDAQKLWDLSNQILGTCF